MPTDSNVNVRDTTPNGMQNSPVASSVTSTTGTTMSLMERSIDLRNRKNKNNAMLEEHTRKKLCLEGDIEKRRETIQRRQEEMRRRWNELQADGIRHNKEKEEFNKLDAKAEQEIKVTVTEIASREEVSKRLNEEQKTLLAEVEARKAEGERHAQEEERERQEEERQRQEREAERLERKRRRLEEKRSLEEEVALLL